MNKQKINILWRNPSFSLFIMNNLIVESSLHKWISFLWKFFILFLFTEQILHFLQFPESSRLHFFFFWAATPQYTEKFEALSQIQITQQVGIYTRVWISSEEFRPKQILKTQLFVWKIMYSLAFIFIVW